MMGHGKREKVRLRSAVAAIVLTLSLSAFSCSGKPSGVETGTSPDDTQVELSLPDLERRPNYSASLKENIGGTKIKLVPEEPTVKDTMRVVFLGDLGGSKAPDFTVTWYLNGSVFTTGSRLPLSGFNKGDRVMARVDFKDGETSPIVSSEKEIGNSPPLLTGVEYETSVLDGRALLQVKAAGTDPDDDEFILKYRFFLNDALVEENRSGTFDISRMSKGDKLYCLVLPGDGESFGKEVPTPVFKISNRPPRITSAPPKEFEGTDYSYKIVAIDPDGDKLEYLLKEGPPGMTLDKATIRWSLVGYAGPSRVKTAITVDDGRGGLADQEFSLFIQQVQQR